MSRGKQGNKANRRDTHIIMENRRKERKRLRNERAEVHKALQFTEIERKARRKGKGEIVKLMLTYGYVPTGREGGDILNKWQKVS